MSVVLHGSESARAPGWGSQNTQARLLPRVLGTPPGRPHTLRPVPTFDALANLPLEIEGYELQPLEFQTPGFERLCTVIHLWGAGEDGLGEDVTYDAVDHIALQDAGPTLDLTGYATLGEFCELMGDLDTFPAEPQRDVSRLYRRWAFESAALDLALRQAGKGLAEVLGREPRPVNFVASMRLSPGEDKPSTIDTLRAKLDRYPDPALQARPDQRLDRRADRRAGRDRRRRLARPQGLLQGHRRRRRDRPRALRQADRGLPRCLARGPRRQRGDPADPRAGPRPPHLGRADPLDRRHRGAALGAEDGQHQALAGRRPAGALRHLRLLRRARHRRLRRRPVGARRRPRPDPGPRLALPPRHAERHGAAAATTKPSRPRACRSARSSHGSPPRAFAGRADLGRPQRRFGQPNSSFRLRCGYPPRRARRRDGREKLCRRAERADRQRVRRLAAVRGGGGLLRRRNAAPARRLLLPPGAGGARARDDDDPVPARRRRGRPHPRHQGAGDDLRRRQRAGADGAGAGEAGQRGDLRPLRAGARAQGLPGRAVPAVVRQGAGRGGRADGRPAQRGRALEARTCCWPRTTSPARASARRARTRPRRRWRAAPASRPW